MNRIVFLDFDGVLHPSSALSDEHFCKSWVLEEVLANVKCGIVISSSWRHHHPLTDIIDMLPATLRPLVQGATGEPHIGRWPRYNEIKDFLRYNAVGASWRALDDSWIEFPPGCPELIPCNPNSGIDKAQANLLKSWLNTGLG